MTTQGRILEIQAEFTDCIRRRREFCDADAACSYCGRTVECPMQMYEFDCGRQPYIDHSDAFCSYDCAEAVARDLASDLAAAE